MCDAARFDFSNASLELDEVGKQHAKAFNDLGAGLSVDRKLGNCFANKSRSSLVISRASQVAGAQVSRHLDQVTKSRTAPVSEKRNQNRQHKIDWP